MARKLVLILLLALSVHGSAGASGKVRGFTIRDLLSVRSIREVALPRQGVSVAFSVETADFSKSEYRSTVHVIENGRVIEVLPPESSASRPLWSSRGDRLACLSEADGDDGEVVDQVWLLRREGWRAEKLTSESCGVKSFDWSPEGSSIAYLAETPPSPARELYRKDRTDEKYDGVEVDKNRPGISLCLQDVKGGEAKVLYHGGAGLEEVAFSPDGSLIAFTDNGTGDPDDEARRDIFVISRRGGAPRKVAERQGREFGICWSPDSRAIAFIGYSDPDHDYSRNDIFTAALADGAVKNISGPHDIGVNSFCWPAGGTALYFTGDRGLSSPLYRIDASTGALTMLTEQGAEYGPFAVSSDGSFLVYGKEDSSRLPELYQKDGKGEKALTSLNGELMKARFAAQEPFRWKSRDGREIEGVLVKPLAYDKGKACPLIVMVHGGPYGRAVNTLRDREYQPFAEAGYMVFAPNYRGSAGYGKEFATEIRGNLMALEFDDVLSGIDALVAAGLADGERIGITGGSYGGYMTNWALSQSPRFKAGVSLYGIFSLIGDMSNSSIPSFEHDYIGKWYWESMEPYLKCSPISYVQNIRAPLLILHGDDDTNTFISNSKELYTALKKLGRTVEFVHYPREGHGFEEPNHLIDAFERSLEWFDRYLPGNQRHYRTGSSLRHGGKILTITAAKKIDQYSGTRPSGVFAEFKAIIENEVPGPFQMSATIAPDASSDISLVAEGKRYYPCGIPQHVMGESLLVRGGALRVAYGKNEKEARGAFPLTFTFDIPPGTDRGELFIEGFPPLVITIDQ
ncbi:MAG: S9 family peptidase [Candidatus Eremiobacteraeota bacterium]|nr:S9 family peptidase [Candidatus Eremiobacteraeota bacterium]